jgi:hypothetical protein
MESSDIIAIILAAVVAALGTVVCIALLRLLPLLRDIDRLISDTQQLIRRLDEVAKQAEHIGKDVRHVEQRVTGVVSSVLDQVEPQVRQLVALAAGVRTTFGKLVKHRGEMVNGSTHETAAMERGRI